MHIYMYYTSSFHIILMIFSTTKTKNKQTNKQTDHLLISFQSQSHVQLFVAPWNTPHQASLSVTYSLSSRRHMSIKTMMPSIHFILCHSLLLLIQIPPIIRDIYELNLCVRWPMYWSFSFSISPPKNTLDWSPYGWTDGICLQSKGL